MYILEVCGSVNKYQGGPYKVVSEISKRIMMDGGALLVGNTKKSRGPVPSFAERYGIGMNLFAKSSIRMFRMADRLVIHGLYMVSTLVAILIMRGDSKAFIMPHGSLESYHLEKSNLVKRVFDVCFRLLARKKNLQFIVATASEKESALVRFPTLHAHTVGLGVSNMPLGTTRKTRGKQARLLFVGRIDPKKRIDLVLETLADLRREGVDANLDIAGVGDHDYTIYLKSYSTTLGIEKYVNWLGFCEGTKLVKIWEISDVFILPSESENFANAVAEAIVHGLPVVISNRVGLANFVQEHELGLVVDIAARGSSKNAVRTILDNYGKYSDNCLESRKSLAWDKVYENWKSVIYFE